MCTTPSGPPTPKPQKTRARKLLALGIGLLVAFAVGEVAVRQRFGAPWPERMPLLRIQAHPTRGWEMVPGEDHYTYDSLVRVNSLGLRGPEVEPGRDGETRVLVLGDSLTYGQGVGEAETLPAQTERMLREGGADWTVANGGLRAYATNQELALLEELAPTIQPDVVVLAWYWNDLIDSNIQGNYERFTKSGPVSFDLGARAEGAVLWKWRFRELLRQSALLMTLYDLVPKTTREAGLDEGRRGELLEKLGTYLDRFEALGEQHGFEFGVFIVPDANDWTSGSSSRSAAIGNEVYRLVAQRGLSVLNPQGVLGLGREGSVPIIPFDGHYTAEGNGILAVKLAHLVRGLAAGGQWLDVRY